MKIVFFFIIFSFSILSRGQNQEFIPPVKIPMLLSGSFAELRSNHFHSGIDIKTQGVTGIPVFAVADGFISRIVVSPSGFGNALYIDHPNGTTTVYGHLDMFNKRIENYVKELQYKNESFRIDVPVSEHLFKVTQGEEVAKSGNSGSSGGPHLHFEIRNTKTEEPLNPLKYNLPVTDKTAPKIFNLLIIPTDKNAQVNYLNSKKSYPAVFYDRQFHLKNNPVIPIYGNVGFAIHANDYFDNSWNKCGLFSMELYIDNRLYFASQMDKFSFTETRFINSFIDYEQLITNRTRYQKAYIEPGNKLRNIFYNEKNGIFNFNDEKIHRVKFVLRDTYGNKSELNFKVESKRKQVEPENNEFVQLFKYNRFANFSTNDFRINIEAGTFYKDVEFNYKTISGDNQYFSDIHVIHTNTEPLHKNAEIQIKTTNLPKQLQSKALAVNVDTITGKFYSAGGKYSDGNIETNIRNFGNYAVSVDTIAPEIIPLSLNKNGLTESNRIRFKITDELSGINKIEGKINGKWALFEYDQKNNLIIHYFDSSRFELNKRHNLVLKITDYKQNTSTFDTTFWK